MAKLSYSPAALDMVSAIHRYISEELKNPAGADNTIAFIRERLNLLKTSPEGGILLSSKFGSVPDALKDARILVCGKYIAVYLYEDETLKILRIYHGAQDYIKHLI